MIDNELNIWADATKYLICLNQTQGCLRIGTLNLQSYSNIIVSEAETEFALGGLPFTTQYDNSSHKLQVTSNKEYHSKDMTHMS